jgi:hypothetical protein
MCVGMRLRPFAFLFLALAACGGEPSDPAHFDGSWLVERTIDSFPEGCPEISVGTVQIHVAGTEVTAEDSTDLTGTVDDSGELQFSTYEDQIGPNGAVGGHSLFYDADSDELVGEGSIGGGSECTYQMTLHAVRIDE